LRFGVWGAAGNRILGIVGIRGGRVLCRLLLPSLRNRGLAALATDAGEVVLQGLCWLDGKSLDLKRLGGAYFALAGGFEGITRNLETGKLVAAVCIAPDRHAELLSLGRLD